MLCLALESFQVRKAWPGCAGTGGICPGSSSTRAPRGSPALLELLDLVLELSTTSPVTNEGFEAGHFIC